MEEMNTTRPRSRATMPGTSSRVSWMGAVRLTSTSSATLSAVISPTGPDQPIPALLIRMSMPAAAQGPAADPAQSDSAACSAALARAAGPSAEPRSASSASPPVCRASAVRRPRSRPAIRGLAPAAARARTVAAPMPDDPPVTSATAPRSRMAPHSGAPAARPQGGLSGGRGRALPVRWNLGAGPAADDVAHRKQPRHLVSLDDHEVPETGLHHGLRRTLEGPVGRREHDVFGAVLGGDLSIWVLPGADRVEDVPLGQDANPGVCGVHHHRGAHPAY